MKAFKQHRELQKITKEVLEKIGQTLSPDDTERSIADRAVSLMRKRGVNKTWYYDCPAFVLAGSRSRLSISGQQYAPHDEPIGPFNLVTLDLSPLRDGLWGDCARSFCIENGNTVAEPKTLDFQTGFRMESFLHQSMRDYVSRSTTFEELHSFANELIKSNGFENLDFIGNLGHSIASRLDERIYIEAGNTACLGDVNYFTFEPHVREVDGQWGFKHENIYYFNEAGMLDEL